MSPDRLQEMREGDVFKFSYSEAERHRSRTDLYWAFDGQVVVRNGRLCDTYWGFDSGDPRVVTPGQGTLTFVCNLNDTEPIQWYLYPQYDDADRFDLSYQHGCRKKYAIRKGATKSLAKQLEILDERVKEAKRDAVNATETAFIVIERSNEQRQKLLAGEDVHI